MKVDGENYIYNGSIWEEVRRTNIIKVIHEVMIADDASTTIWTPATGKTINLQGWSVAGYHSSADVNSYSFELYDGAIKIGASYFKDADTKVFFPNNGFKFSAAGNALTLKNTSSGTGKFSAMAWGYET